VLIVALLYYISSDGADDVYLRLSYPCPYSTVRINNSQR